ncbi:hypothetical protein TELCIR_08843 [Teladorsagia circumcincta]|uniref:Uncharacterized protein n=1 Tax=Teladorsagia circumcincta TaxID=45464 RepID=A0A2G9UGH0_TELCI|nr:hypothetical protein TELCIR_08843 [Teladorsagia circumcincta]
MLSPEATLVANDERVVDSKLLELQKIVEQLTEENTRLQQRRTTEDTKMAKEIEDLRRRSKLQENRILELEKICDDVDETESKLRRRIIELEKEISAQKGSPLKAKVAAPRLLDALQHRLAFLEEDDEREEERIEAGKEAPYVSAPTSPQLVQKCLDETESPMYEESVVESAATPNRSLHTTLYKRLDKTAKLSDTPESKANTSRCAQQ